MAIPFCRLCYLANLISYRIFHHKTPIMLQSSLFEISLTYPDQETILAEMEAGHIASFRQLLSYFNPEMLCKALNVGVFGLAFLIKHPVKMTVDQFAKLAEFAGLGWPDLLNLILKSRHAEEGKDSMVGPFRTG